MSDSEHLTQVFGGATGTAVILTSLFCTIASWVGISLAEAQSNKVNTSTATLAHFDGKSISGFLCFSLIALFGAMLIELTYVLHVVGPRAIFARHIAPSIRGRLTFYLVLTFYWLSFAGVQVCLIIGLINVRHEKVPEIFTYAYNSMILVLLSTMILHVIANEIRWCLLGIAWIDGFSSVVQSEGLEDCVICLETPAIGENIRSLPCKHKFHQKCLDEWLLRNTSCPLCRWTISGSDMLVDPEA